MFTLSWPCGFPAMLADSGGCATRYAQTVLAESPDSAPLLGHAKGDEAGGEKQGMKVKFNHIHRDFHALATMYSTTN